MKDTFLHNVAAREHNAALATLYQRPQTICYLEAEDQVTHLFLENDTRFTVNAKLFELEKLLPSNKFFCCGDTYIINIDKVLEYWISNDPFLVITCGHIVPVSPKDMFQVQEFILSNSDGLLKKPKIVSRI